MWRFPLCTYLQRRSLIAFSSPLFLLISFNSRCISSSSLCFLDCSAVLKPLSFMESARHGAFFPKADAAVLRSKFELPSVRPSSLGPVFDVAQSKKPMNSWTTVSKDGLYPDNVEEYAVAITPEKPLDFSERYLRPFLTRNERLRLTMLFYYCRHVFDDEELLSRIEEKVYLAKESIGWVSSSCRVPSSIVLCLQDVPFFCSYLKRS